MGLFDLLVGSTRHTESASPETRKLVAFVEGGAVVSSNVAHWGIPWITFENSGHLLEVRWFAHRGDVADVFLDGQRVPLSDAEGAPIVAAARRRGQEIGKPLKDKISSLQINNDRT